MKAPERIGKVVGAKGVVPGVARIASRIIEPGVIRRPATSPRSSRREQRRAERARTAAFHKACKDAGIDATLSANIGRELWIVAMLAPHAATALMRGPIGIVRSNPKSRELCRPWSRRPSPSASP